MAVVLERMDDARVEFDPNVVPFLETHVALRARLPELLRAARQYFPESRFRLVAERDPDDYAWEYVVLEVHAHDQELASDPLGRFLNECVSEITREFPGEFIAITRAD